jgi:hypothetical protein
MDIMNNKQAPRQVVQGRLARFASIFSGNATTVRFEGSKVCTNQEGIITLPSEFHRLSPEMERRAFALVSHEMGHDFVNFQLKDLIERGERNQNSEKLFKAIVSRIPKMKSVLMNPKHKAKKDGTKLFVDHPNRVALKLIESTFVGESWDEIMEILRRMDLSELPSGWEPSLSEEEVAGALISLGKVGSTPIEGLIKVRTKALASVLGSKIRNLLNAVEDPRQENLSSSRLEGTRIWFRESNDEALLGWARKMESKDAVVQSESLTGIASIYYLERGEMGDYLDDEVKEVLDLYRSETWTTPTASGMFDALNVAVFIFVRQFGLSLEEMIRVLLDVDPPTDGEGEGDGEGSEGEGSEDDSSEDDSSEDDGSEGEGSEGEDSEGSEGSEDDDSDSSEGEGIKGEDSEGEESEGEDGSKGEDSEEAPEDDSEDDSARAGSREADSSKGDKETESSSSKGDLRGQFVRLPDGRIGQILSESEDGELEVKVIK